MDKTTNTARAAALYNSRAIAVVNLGELLLHAPTDLQVFNVTECPLANGETPSTSSFQWNQ